MSYTWPVDPGYVITQPFGPTTVTAESPITWPGGQNIPAGYYAHFHRGIDLGNGKCGGNIYAAGAGRVHYSGLISVPSAPGGWQSLIVLDHGGGNATIYIHEATRLVVAGQTVTGGQPIATVGAVGATACHLHYGTKAGVDFAGDVLADSNGQWLDPQGVTEEMYAVDLRTPLEAPNPRAFTIPAGTKLNGYDPAQPGKVVKTFGPQATASSAHADARDKVTWNVVPQPVPNGAGFLHVVDGVLAGLLVIEALVQLDPASPVATPTPLGPGVYKVG